MGRQGRGHGNIDEEMESRRRTENGKRITEAQAIFLYLFAVCSSCTTEVRRLNVVGEETNESYKFGNGLNGLNSLAHLWWNLMSSASRCTVRRTLAKVQRRWGAKEVRRRQLRAEI
jgi:hypothetical protein